MNRLQAHVVVPAFRLPTAGTVRIGSGRRRIPLGALFKIAASRAPPIAAWKVRAASPTCRCLSPERTVGRAAALTMRMISMTTKSSTRVNPRVGCATMPGFSRVARIMGCFPRHSGHHGSRCRRPPHSAEDRGLPHSELSRTIPLRSYSTIRDSSVTSSCYSYRGQSTGLRSTVDRWGPRCSQSG